MNNINIDIYQKYSKDLAALINHFTESKERTKEVMLNLKLFIENETAIVGGHIIDDKLASFIWCYERNFGGKQRLHISYFIVAEKFRGQGLSKDLLKFAENSAKEIGIGLIDLNVEPQNEKAIKVYENSGFMTEKLQLVMKINEGDKDV